AAVVSARDPLQRISCGPRAPYVALPPFSFSRDGSALPGDLDRHEFERGLESARSSRRSVRADGRLAVGGLRCRAFAGLALCWLRGVPAAAEGLVEDDGVVGEHGLADRELVLGGELAALGVEHLEEVREAGLVALARERGGLALRGGLLLQRGEA